MPKRAIAALLTTTLAVILLLSFKTPSQQMAATGAVQVVGQAQPSAAAAAPVGTTATAAPANLNPAAQGQAAAGSTGGTASGATSGTAATPPPTQLSATPKPATASNANATVTGPVVDTPYGPVQVQVTVKSGKIVDVAALQTPSDQMRSQMIAQYAVPVLRQEALQAQSAQIDLVSGATYTSMGYAQSLQAALDQLPA